MVRNIVLLFVSLMLTLSSVQGLGMPADAENTCLELLELDGDPDAMSPSEQAAMVSCMATLGSR